MQSFKSKRAKSEMFALLANSDSADLLYQFQRKRGHVYVFAGAVRDLLAWQDGRRNSTLPRDFDIGVSGLSRAAFDALMKKAGAKPNRYSGYQLLHDNSPPWDIWRLEDSIGLRLTRTLFSLENVLRSFVIDCNALAFDIDSGEFLHLGSVQAIRNKRIDIVRNAILHSRSTFAAKAAILGFKHSFQLSPALREFVRHHLEKSTLQHELRKNLARETSQTQVVTMRILNGARRPNSPDC